MIALYIIGGLVLLFVGIGFIRVKVTLTNKESFDASLKILFLNIKLYPRKKKKKVNYKKFSAKKLRREIKKQEKKDKKAALKKARKKAKKAERKKAKALKKKNDKKLKRRNPSAYAEQKRQEKAKKRSLPEILSAIKSVLDNVSSRIKRNMRVTLKSLRINVATGDPAKTAILYGAVSGSLAAILEIVDRTMNVKYEDSYEPAVNADFLAEKTTADVDISFSISIRHALGLVISTLFKAILKLKK